MRKLHIVTHAVVSALGRQGGCMGLLSFIREHMANGRPRLKTNKDTIKPKPKQQQKPRQLAFEPQYPR